MYKLDIKKSWLAPQAQYIDVKLILDSVKIYARSSTPCLLIER